MQAFQTPAELTAILKKEYSGQVKLQEAYEFHARCTVGSTQKNSSRQPVLVQLNLSEGDEIYKNAIVDTVTVFSSLTFTPYEVNNALFNSILEYAPIKKMRIAHEHVWEQDSVMENTKSAPALIYDKTLENPAFRLKYELTGLHRFLVEPEYLDATEIIRCIEGIGLAQYLYEESRKKFQKEMFGFFDSISTTWKKDNHHN